MLQKVKDLVERARSERKMTVILVVICAMVLFMVFSTSNQPAPRQAGLDAAKKGEPQIALAQKEAYEDLQRRFVSELEDIKTDNRALRQESEEIRKGMSENEERTAEIFKKILEKMADGQGSGPGTSNVSQLPKPVDLGDPNAAPSAPDSGLGAVEDASLSTAELESFGMDQKEVAPPPPPGPDKLAFIGAGDSVRVKLLAGVNAPTDGTPYPVVFKLVSDVHGPDGSVLPLGEARLIAAAQGSLTDSRALFRLSSINIRLPNGQRKVLKADGWIVGEDGIRGMPGVLIDPIGKAIGGAGFAAGVSAAGEGLSAANSTLTYNTQTGQAQTFVTGNIGQYAAGKAIGGAGREWSGIIKDRLSEMVPVVQVLSGREGTAVFAKSLTVNGLFEALEDAEGAPGAMD